MLKRVKAILSEFQEFIDRGNVIDLAVGVIIGGAFTSVVNSLVNNIITPLISFLSGGTSELPGLSIDLGGQTIDFSAFLGDCVSFLITAVAIFAIVKTINKLNRVKTLAAEKAGIAALAKKEDETPKPRLCPYCRQQIEADATRCPHCTSKLEGYSNPQE